MRKDSVSKIEEVVINSLKSNIELQDRINILQEKNILDKRELLLDLVQILDSFEKAEITILEKGWDKSELSDKAIKRLLTAKKKVISILEKYDVSKIEFPNNVATPEESKTVGIEPDNTKPEGYIISIERNGYKFHTQVLRYAEVIIVKN